MSDAKGNQEPSMEEILASIRRIISEDGEPKEESAAAVNGHAPEPADVEDEDDDALVLTDMVVGDSNVVELQEEPSPEVVAPLPAPPVLEPAPPLAELPEPEPLPQPAMAIQEDEDIVSDSELDADEPAVPEKMAAPIQDDEVAAVTDVPLEDDLVSPDVVAASAASMAQLFTKKSSTSQPRESSIDGLLVETLVRQAIEPMLKEWLDEHLQEIVERLVRREVERLSRKAELN